MKLFSVFSSRQSKVFGLDQLLNRLVVWIAAVAGWAIPMGLTKRAMLAEDSVLDSADAKNSELVSFTRPAKWNRLADSAMEALPDIVVGSVYQQVGNDNLRTIFEPAEVHG